MENTLTAKDLGKSVRLPAFDDNPEEYGVVVENPFYDRGYQDAPFCVLVADKYLMGEGDEGYRTVIEGEIEFI